LLENPQVLALCASFLFGLALVLTQFGLRHVPPTRGASISIPTSAVLLSALAPFMLDWDGWDPRGALIFVLVGLLFPATVTLLTFEANRRMGPSVSGARSAAGSPRGASACRAQSRLIDNVITIMAMLSACSGRGTSLNRNAATTTANSGVRLRSG
jgi:hypothetical protein